MENTLLYIYSTNMQVCLRNDDVNNHIAEHHLQTKHQIHWDSATCIDGFQSRDETAMLVHKTIANYGSYFA